MRLFSLCLIAFLTSSCGKKQVDFIIHHATVYTVDSTFRVASTLVIHQGKLIAVGDSSLLSTYDAKETLDAKGQFIYPGFQDAHCHFTGYALDKEKLDLQACTSIQDILQACKIYAAEANAGWIYGRQWDEHRFKQKERMDKHDLDAAFPDRPVFLLRVDGHAALCNQRALDLCGIDEHSTFSGGKIGFNGNHLNGLVYDNAMRFISSKIPELSDSLAIHFYQLTEKEFLQNGITSFTDCMVENHWMHAIEEAYAQKKLNIHGSFVLTHSAANWKEYHNTPTRYSLYQICGFKLFADGSLGSRGACLFEPYHDDPSHQGYLTLSMDSIRKVAEELVQTKYQLFVHAIGDKTNHDVLTVLNAVLPEGNDRRWRMEHVQVLRPEDRNLFKTKNIIPSVQPTHATSDMLWVEERLGKDRMKHAYAYQALLQLHGWLPLGTDFPVEPLNPLHTFYAAVARKNADALPAQGFQMENALRREDALRGITIWPAKGVFRENETGSLEVGKEADFVILPVDLMHDDLKAIRESKILATYIHGKKVFEKH